MASKPIQEQTVMSMSRSDIAPDLLPGGSAKLAEVEARVRRRSPTWAGLRMPPRRATLVLHPSAKDRP